MGLTLVTYGGGEILNNVFNALAMLNGKKGNFIQALMIVSLSVGFVWAISKAFFSTSSHAFFVQFFLPVLAITGVLMVPTSSVHIEDVLKDCSYKVDHVPFLLAKISELSNTIGYQTTLAVEKVMHVPDDVSYNSTGMIFGADAAMDISRYKITNANLEENLHNFCRQCVLYDLHLGRYSIDELKKTTDLWTFLAERTSKVGMMKYIPIVKDKDQKQSISEYVTCKDAIKKMTPYFEKEKNYYAQLNVCKNLGLTFKALTGMQKNAEELIGQQLMMNVLTDEYSGNNFAKSRAYIQQRNTYQALGSLASGSLITLRAVLEALVYAAFIFVLPLSVLPGGVKYLMTWTGLVLWIQLWPPFYAILNYIMQSVSHGYADTVFHGLTGAQQGLSLFTSIGLQNLQQDIYALSGYLAASIPFITYAILKGGVSSFVHLAGSMMSPAHSAASTAAAEQTTGNYSFGNTSFGQTSYKNTTGLQTNLAPSLSGGYFQENSGLSSAIYGHDEQILKQGNSDLRTSLFSDDSISQSLQTSKMHAQSTVDSAQKNYSEGLSTHSRNMADFTKHLGNSENYSNGFSQREAYDLQESARYCQNMAENWGKQYGLSSSQSMELFLGAGLDILGNGAKASTLLGGNKNEALSSANNLFKSEEFQKHFQKIQDVSSSESYGYLNDTGRRLAESSSESLEQMRCSQNAYQIAQSDLNQISENATWAQQNSHLVRHSRNQDFVNWASAKYANEGGFAKVQDLVNKGNTAELVSEYVDFIKSESPPLRSPEGYMDPQAAYSRILPNQVTFDQGQETLNQHVLNSSSQLVSNISQHKEELSRKFSQTKEMHGKQFEQVSSKVESAREDAMENFQSESNRSLYARPFRLAKEEGQVHINLLGSLIAKMNNASFPQMNVPIASSFQIKEEPFWMKPEDMR